MLRQRRYVYTIPYQHRYALFVQRVLFRLFVGLIVLLAALLGLPRLLAPFWM